MFEQIVKDMHVPPEILCELTDEQKDVLHYEIRQEQIRRYNEWQKSTENDTNDSKTKRKLKFHVKKKKEKHVNFVEEPDGKLHVQRIYLDSDNVMNGHTLDIHPDSGVITAKHDIRPADAPQRILCSRHVPCCDKETTAEQSKLLHVPSISLQASDDLANMRPQDWFHHVHGDQTTREFVCGLRRRPRVEQRSTPSVQDCKTSTVSINLQQFDRSATQLHACNADPTITASTDNIPSGSAESANEKLKLVGAPSLLASRQITGKNELSDTLRRVYRAGQFMEPTSPIHRSTLHTDVRGTSSSEQQNHSSPELRTDDSSSDSDASVQPRGRGFQRLFVVDCTPPVVSSKPTHVSQTAGVTFITTHPRFTSPALSSPGNTLTTDRTDSDAVIHSHLPRTEVMTNREANEVSTDIYKTPHPSSPCAISRVSADIRRRQEELFRSLNPSEQETPDSIWFYTHERLHLMQEFALPFSGVDLANPPPQFVNVPKWFHGPMSKFTAEELLRRDKRNGAYLVRVSSTFCGYVISWLWNGQCQHQLVSVIHPRPHNCASRSQRHIGSAPSYQLYPQTNSNHFGSLKELILFYAANSLTYPDRQYLLYAVGQQPSKNGLPDYADLFYPRSTVNRNTRL